MDQGVRVEAADSMVATRRKGTTEAEGVAIEYRILSLMENPMSMVIGES